MGNSTQFILALDQGTTSSRAILFDTEGAIVTVAQREFEQYFPRAGWVEHDPLEIWSSQIGVAGEALRAAGIGPGELAAIGITNQRETTVLWDRRTGEPVHRAIVWQDRRTAPMIDRLNADGCADMVRATTGPPPAAYCSATPNASLLAPVPRALAGRADAPPAARRHAPPRPCKLTEGRLHVTDVSNASRTMLYDIHAGRWDDDLLALFTVPRSVLPEVRSSSEVYGEVSVSLPGGPVPSAGHWRPVRDGPSLPSRLSGGRLSRPPQPSGSPPVSAIIRQDCDWRPYLIRNTLELFIISAVRMSGKEDQRRWIEC